MLCLNINTLYKFNKNKNLKNLDMNISDIQKATGLSEEIIKGL